MSSRSREWPVGFKGAVGIASCVIGLSVVYFGYGIDTVAVNKTATVEARPAAPDDRKRPVRAMNLALGNMVFFARELGFAVTGAPSGELDPDRIAGRIEGQLQEIRQLYREQIVKNPALAGGLMLQFTITASGGVSEVRELGSRLNDPNFKQAVAEAVAKWSFGDVAGSPLQVNCPLLFVHEGMDITTLIQWEKALLIQWEKALAQAQPAAPPPPIGNNNKEAPAATTARATTKEFRIKYATSLRKDPHFTSASLASVGAGTKVKVLQRQGDWLEVIPHNDGPIGFVRKEFVSAVEVARR